MILIYWKKGIHFGKTSETRLKELRAIDVHIKTISSFYFYILSFIKYLFMIMFVPFVILGFVIITVCEYLINILYIPISKYNNYFFK